MARLPDLVRDSELPTEFLGAVTIHSFDEIDGTGRRYRRKEHWKWDRTLGRGGFGQVKLQRCTDGDTKPRLLRAVKIIEKTPSISKSLDYHRELEAIAKFSNPRVRIASRGYQKLLMMTSVQKMVRHVVRMV